ncbi:MAG TPA: hypothetical protein VLA21_11350 [Candidatus Limnocylindria bacterium]|nr:hypothetical protein [Candidatus Limnocylindria bacterium]
MQPLKCRLQDVHDLMQECVDIHAPILELTVQMESKSRKIGISSDMNRSGKYFDTLFFLDDKDYASLDEMFSALGYPPDMMVFVMKEEGVDDPRDYTLLAQREIM